MTPLLARETGGAPANTEILGAVKLRKAEFAFLDERIVSDGRRASLGESLRASLLEQEPDVIREVLRIWPDIRLPDPTPGDGG